MFLKFFIHFSRSLKNWKWTKILDYRSGALINFPKTKNYHDCFFITFSYPKVSTSKRKKVLDGFQNILSLRLSHDSKINTLKINKFGPHLIDKKMVYLNDYHLTSITRANLHKVSRLLENHIYSFKDYI